MFLPQSGVVTTGKPGNAPAIHAPGRLHLVRRRYAVQHLEVEVLGEPAVVGTVHSALEHQGFARAAESRGMPDIAVRCWGNRQEVCVPPGATLLSEHEGIRAWSDNGALYLTCEGYTCRLDLPGGVAEVVTPPLHALHARVRKDLITYTLLLLLRRRGLFALHASGVARDGTGCLFVAPSGGGKSAQTYSLVRQGWKYLGDDAVLLRGSQEEVEALALRRDLCLAPSLAHAFPEVVRGRDTAFGSQGKQRLSMEALYPYRLINGCVPRLLIFPEIVSASVSRLVPLHQAEAYVRLMQESMVLTLDPDSVPLHLRVLASLVRQSQCWRLLAGRDLKEQPQLVGRLLESACACIPSHAPHEPP